jgi:UDP-N-acetyl-D-mannosaminuronate dehydrogenase
VIEESQGVFLAKALSKAGARVVAYDPLAGAVARDALLYSAVVLDSVAACLSEADAALITTPDPEFRRLTAADFPVRPNGIIVVDFWRILRTQLSGAKHVRYVPIGCSGRDAENTAALVALWEGVASTKEGA